MSTSKTCSCGKHHIEIPEPNQLASGLIWANCECGSTMCWREAETFEDRYNVLDIVSFRSRKIKEAGNRMLRARRNRREAK